MSLIASSSVKGYISKNQEKKQSTNYDCRQGGNNICKELKTDIITVSDEIKKQLCVIKLQSCCSAVERNKKGHGVMSDTQHVDRMRLIYKHDINCTVVIVSFKE